MYSIHTALPPWEENAFIHFSELLCKYIREKCDVECIITGSRADGTSIGGSDLDVMFFPRSFTLDESCFEYNEKCPCYFRVVHDDKNEIPDKYVTKDRKYLKATSFKESPFIPSNLTDAEKGKKVTFRHIPSKVGFAGSTKNEYDMISLTGEMTTVDLFEEQPIDIVPSVRISGCDNYMKIWSSRKRLWPPSKVVEDLVKGQLYAVAKVAPLNGDVERDFYLSFTIAEKTLMTAMSDDQLLCMKGLKLVKSKLHDLMELAYPECFHRTTCDGQGEVNLSSRLKGLKLIKSKMHNLKKLLFHRTSNVDNGEANQALEDVFSSYHFKMAMFWVSETTKSSCWTNSHECIYKVLFFFLDCLKNNSLPHYFVPSMNLFCAFSEETMRTASVAMQLFIQPGVLKLS